MNENQNEYVDINAHDNYPDSEQKIEIPTMKVIPLKKICMTIGELPTSYLETMTYYEMLVWFIEFLKNNIIPTINNNASAIQEVQNVVLNLQKYINNYKDSIDSDVEELEEYMNNYFENLDVQEEINNKLDQMLEDGVLEQIIEQFIQSTAIWCFDNVADMKQATNLINGSFAKTLGYYSINDEGASLYKIRTKTNDDVIDEMVIVSLNGNNLVAELIFENEMCPEQFGAYGDNIHDDTSPIQCALNIASSGKILILNKNYIVSQLTIKNGTKEIRGNGTIKGNGSHNDGLILLGESGNPLKNCTISINLDLSAGEERGFNGYSVENCIFKNCKIYNGTIKATNTYYLRIVESIKNRFENNTFIAPTNPKTGNHYLLILSHENEPYIYGGIFDEGHTIHYSGHSNVDNIITNNYFQGGTHGCVLSYSLRNTITNNNFKYHSHRGVAIQSACSYNTINDNQFEGIRSSGVLMTYGCSYNEISNNTFIDNLEISPTVVGQGVICGYLHIMHNKISNNIIKSGRLYGISLSVDVIGNTIENNDISDYYLTGIYLGNDWIPSGYVWSDNFTLPTDAKFSRLQSVKDVYTDSNGTPVDYVGYYNTENNTIQNNKIHKSIINNATACIYLCELGNRLKLQNNVIQNNTYDGVVVEKYYLYLYQETTDYCVNNSLINNLINGTTGEKNINRFYMTEWRKHFINQYDNDVLDKGWVVTTGSTINAYYSNLYRIANSEATTLTSITGTKQDDEILLRLDSNTTIQHASGGNLRLRGGTNITPQSANAFIKFINLDGVNLFELYRNF